MPRVKRVEIDPEDKQQAIDTIRELMPEGSKIFILSRTNGVGGGTHTISCFVAKLDEDGQPTIECIDNYLKAAMGYKSKEEGADGFVMSGEKEDLGVSLVATLSFKVFKDFTKYQHQWL